MTRSTPFLAALLALAATIGAADVLAQAQSRLDGRLFKACGDDLLKHCRTVSPGNGRVLACLQRQGPELSATCQAELPKLARCSQEVQRLCGDISPAQWRACFESRREQFSADCQQVVPR